MASVHSSKRRFQCDICNKWFKRKEILNGHRLVVHMNVEKEQCEVCGLGFTSQTAKSLHMLKHDKRKRHGCNFCSKR